MRARTDTDYDQRGRADVTTVDSVDPASGYSIAAPTLVTKDYYDGRDDVIATSQPGGAWIKSSYDGAGDQTMTATTDGASGTPTSISGDMVFAEQQTAYDGDGDPKAITTTQRNADGSARVSYLNNYFDAGDRKTASADFGTDAASAGAYAATPPPASSALVTGYTYDSGGWLYTLTDPAGIKTTNTNDALGRPAEVVQATPGAAGNATLDTTNKYDGLDHVTNTTVQNFAPGLAAQPQTTNYIYSKTVIPGAASLTNENLLQIQYPGYVNSGNDTNNLTGAPNQESFKYDNLDEMIGDLGRNAVQHTYTHDAVGQTVEDDAYYAASTASPTPPVDMSVAGRTFTYSALGQLLLASTYGPDSAVGRFNPVTGTGAAATPINQVEDAYNGFGQLITQYQQHSGAVAPATSPSVQNHYVITNNSSQLQSFVFPDGRLLDYGYDNIDRVNSIADPPSDNNNHLALETYGYLGLGPIVQRTRPISVTNGPGGTVTTQITGKTTLDAFGRIGNVDWKTSIVLDRQRRDQHVHDRSRSAPIRLRCRLQPDLQSKPSRPQLQRAVHLRLAGAPERILPRDAHRRDDINRQPGHAVFELAARLAGQPLRPREQPHGHRQPVSDELQRRQPAESAAAATYYPDGSVSNITFGGKNTDTIGAATPVTESACTNTTPGAT